MPQSQPTTKIPMICPKTYKRIIHLPTPSFASTDAGQGRLPVLGARAGMPWALGRLRSSELLLISEVPVFFFCPKRPPARRKRTTSQLEPQVAVACLIDVKSCGDIDPPADATDEHFVGE